MSADYLRDSFLPRLERALEVLPEGDLWWRPHEEALAVGNILLHLEGNVRQWVCSGLGGSPDRRERAAEFAAPQGRVEAEDGAGLLERLRATVEQAAAVMASMDAADLERTYSIQGDEVTGVRAITHVVEHFSWHTGQAVWIAKARAGRGHGLAFHDEQRANAARNG